MDGVSRTASSVQQATAVREGQLSADFAEIAANQQDRSPVYQEDRSTMERNGRSKTGRSETMVNDDEHMSADRRDRSMTEQATRSMDESEEANRRQERETATRDVQSTGDHHEQSMGQRSTAVIGGQPMNSNQESMDDRHVQQAVETTPDRHERPIPNRTLLNIAQQIISDAGDQSKVSSQQGTASSSSTASNVQLLSTTSASESPRMIGIPCILCKSKAFYPRDADLPMKRDYLLEHIRWCLNYCPYYCAYEFCIGSFASKRMMDRHHEFHHHGKPKLVFNQKSVVLEEDILIIAKLIYPDALEVTERKLSWEQYTISSDATGFVNDLHKWHKNVHQLYLFMDAVRPRPNVADPNEDDKDDEPIIGFGFKIPKKEPIDTEAAAVVVENRAAPSWNDTDFDDTACQIIEEDGTLTPYVVRRALIKITPAPLAETQRPPQASPIKSHQQSSAVRPTKHVYAKIDVHKKVNDSNGRPATTEASTSRKRHSTNKEGRSKSDVRGSVQSPTSRAVAQVVAAVAADRVVRVSPTKKSIGYASFRKRWCPKKQISATDTPSTSGAASTSYATPPSASATVGILGTPLALDIGSINAAATPSPSPGARSFTPRTSSTASAASRSSQCNRKPRVQQIPDDGRLRRKCALCNIRCLKVSERKHAESHLSQLGVWRYECNMCDMKTIFDDTMKIRHAPIVHRVPNPVEGVHFKDHDVEFGINAQRQDMIRKCFPPIDGGEEGEN